MAKKEKKAKVLPGLDCKSDVACKQKSAKVCSLLIQGHVKGTPLPTGWTAAKTKKFCVENQLGSPFLIGMSPSVKKYCVVNGKALSVKDCRAKMLSGDTGDSTDVGADFRLDRVVSKSTPLITSTLKGDPIMPATQASKKSCRPPGKFNAKKPLRSCQYELEFFTADQARAKKLPRPGPYIRICGEKAFAAGALYPVDSPEQAKEIMDEHCACRKKGGKSNYCQKKSGIPVAFGFAGRRRSSRLAGRHTSRSACDADMARDQALQDVTDWDDWDSDFKVRTPKVVWRTLIRDAGLRPADLVRAEKVAEKDDGYERREIWKKLVEQIKNASNAQVCAYDRQRSSAINRGIW